MSDALNPTQASAAHFGAPSNPLTDKIKKHALALASVSESLSAAPSIDSFQTVKNEVAFAVFAKSAACGNAHCQERLFSDDKMSETERVGYAIATTLSGIDTLCSSWNIGSVAGVLSRLNKQIDKQQ